MNDGEKITSEGYAGYCGECAHLATEHQDPGVYPPPEGKGPNWCKAPGCYCTDLTLPCYVRPHKEPGALRR